MPTRSILLTSWFWIAFVVVAIMVMFTLGMRRANDNSLLARSRRKVEQLQADIDARERERAVMVAALESKTNELSSQARVIRELDAEASKLRAELPPYGRGKGLLSLFNACACSDVRIWIDGTPAGSPSYLSNARSRRCAAIGAVTSVLSPGDHKITARDALGHSWSFEARVHADECTMHILTLD